ncbi:peroxiredoxin [Phycicoccus sp. Soil748]|uniref:peroxiredoxin n=1 Tax=Phycicoccus sp. Soil748 TaxID=1736397 RepID=UPI000703587B|nr:peroxiredoxin [Phycicoccus sp. Soil748]KRE52731.1 peroxiredoxin [Phycicoccus sp. Soil748]
MKSLQIGDLAPEFDLPDQTGRSRSLASLLDEGSVVLFFYPSALSSGCTKEACHFRDLRAELAALGAQPVGISMDTVDAQARFDGKESLGMPLLSDADGAVATAYGVRRKYLTPVKRATFVIAPDRRIVEVVQSEWSMDRHADAALTALSARVAR